MRPGDSVVVLREYRVVPGTLLKINKKSISIQLADGYMVRADPSKVALRDEPLILVWEMWRGVNGRGGYRLERDLYKEYHRPAQQCSTSRGYHVVESLHGILDGVYMDILH